MELASLQSSLDLSFKEELEQVRFYYTLVFKKKVIFVNLECR